MSDKFANRYGKRILQYKRTSIFEKTQHKSLFNIFCNEGVSRRMIQSYVEKRVISRRFEKGYTPNWTEMFRIVKVLILRTNPVTYLLEDYRKKSVAGGFYEYELYRVAKPDVYLVEKV